MENELVGSEIREKIREIGRLWRQSRKNPAISNTVTEKWDRLVEEWKDDRDMPLVVRKSTGIRGGEIRHNTGRLVIISDNSFPQWVYYHVMFGKIYTKDEMKAFLRQDEIPFSFATKKTEMDKVVHKKTLGKFSLNKEGWKLCHIEPIGLNDKTPVEEIDIKRLEEHFIKLASPGNMFVVPLEIGGIGEIQEFISEQKKR